MFKWFSKNINKILLIERQYREKYSEYINTINKYRNENNDLKRLEKYKNDNE